MNKEIIFVNFTIHEKKYKESDINTIIKDRLKDVLNIGNIKVTKVTIYNEEVKQNE